MGQNPRILQSERHDAAFYKAMWDALKRGKVWHGHFINKRKDGTLCEEDAIISPIRDTLGFCEITLVDMSPQDVHRQDLIEIEKASHRAADLTRQLLAFSRRPD